MVCDPRGLRGALAPAARRAGSSRPTARPELEPAVSYPGSGRASRRRARGGSNQLTARPCRSARCRRRGSRPASARPGRSCSRAVRPVGRRDLVGHVGVGEQQRPRSRSCRRGPAAPAARPREGRGWYWISSLPCSIECTKLTGSGASPGRPRRPAEGAGRGCPRSAGSSCSSGGTRAARRGVGCPRRAGPPAASQPAAWRAS